MKAMYNLMKVVKLRFRLIPYDVSNMAGNRTVSEIWWCSDPDNSLAAVSAAPFT